MLGHGRGLPASTKIAPVAYIEHRGEKWRVLIRRRGHAPISRTFRLKAQAERWAKETEVALEAEHAGPLGKDE